MTTKSMQNDKYLKIEVKNSIRHPFEVLSVQLV